MLPLEALPSEIPEGFTAAQWNAFTPEQKAARTNYAYQAMSERNSMDFVTGGHWFNCGPTGIRASIDYDHPTEFHVQYVFPGSPADKKILKGDRIVGANGKRWTEKDPFKFGADKSFGYYGPRRMLGLAIEESEAKKGAFSGTLSLIVMRGGKQVDVKVFLDRIGTFAPNFPYDCEKSQILIDNASEFLLEHSNPNHRRWQGHGHVQYMALMGLLAQGDKHMDFIKKYIDANYSDRPKGDDEGAWTWTKAMDGVMIAELYLATKDRRLIPHMEALDKWYSKARTPWGAYKHHPYIKPGVGYGPMAHPTAITCAAWAMFKKCGVKIDEESYMESRRLLDYLTSASGGLGYGAGLPEGVEAVPAAFQLKRGEPQDGRPWRSFGATGYSTMFHYLDPLETYSDYYVQRGLKAVAYCKELIPDGHASSSVSLWAGFMTAALAPAVGRGDIYREFCDYYKAWLNVNRCHDGSFYNTPNRDVNQDGGTGSRFNTTGTVLLLLSAPKRNLYILGKGTQGAGSPIAGTPAVSEPAAAAEPETPSVRTARKMKPERREILDNSLKSALSKMSESNGLTEIPIGISSTRSRVWLKEVSGDGKLTFQIVGGKKTASFEWDDLQASDYATLSLLVASLKPESNDAQAMAAVYMESLGKIVEAEKYYEKAGEDSRKKLEALFQ